MGDVINSFLVAFLSGESLTSICLLLFVYISLFLSVRFIITDTAEDGTFFLVIANIIVNIVYCVRFLPDHYLVLTKIVYFFIPYLIAFAIIGYMDFLNKKKGDKSD